MGKLSLPRDIPKGGRGRGLMMPTREHTRVQERQARIDYERGVERGSIEVLTDDLSRTTKTELCIDRGAVTVS
jgi:hypothetical protein